MDPTCEAQPAQPTDMDDGDVGVDATANDVEVGDGEPDGDPGLMLDIKTIWETPNHENNGTTKNSTLIFRFSGALFPRRLAKSQAAAAALPTR